MVKYIIEHLEPKLWKWCMIEYKHISLIVGKENLIFTNIKEDNKELKNYGEVIKKSVKELDLKNMCILDPEASKTLNPKEAKKFDYFIFGGILGDNPPKKRTKEELTPFVKGEVRNIGKAQFSTDNAVFVVKSIYDGIPLEKIKFQDEIEIVIKQFESIILPYKYALVKGKPFVSNELVDYLKRKKGF